MKFELSIITSLLVVNSVGSFTISPRTAFLVGGASSAVANNRTRPQFQLKLSSSSDNNDNAAGRSNLEGNRAPTPQEIAIMDEMITKMSKANVYELPNAVSKAFRVCSSPRFFMRIAERADQATTQEERDRLSAFANNIVQTLEAVVSTTENKLDERSREVEQVVKAAAEPASGEFLVPLTPERIEAMQKEVSDLEPGVLDESFLLTVDAWMNKSSQDGIDGMVVILQKVLQMYAGVAITRARSVLQAQVGAAITETDIEEANNKVTDASSKSPASALLDQILLQDTDNWDVSINNCTNDSNNNVTLSELKNELQRTMEAIVLGLENGSMTQRVQAEYLRELMTRIEAAA